MPNASHAPLLLAIDYRKHSDNSPMLLERLAFYISLLYSERELSNTGNYSGDTMLRLAVHEAIKDLTNELSLHYYPITDPTTDQFYHVVLESEDIKTAEEILASLRAQKLID